MPGKKSWLTLLVPLILLTACAGPFSTLDPAGPSARYAAWLWWSILILFGLIMALVVSLFLYALYRRRPDFVARSDWRQLRWFLLGGGVLLPITSIVLLLAFGIPLGHRMLPLTPESGDALRIEVTGHQWWWQVHYPDAGVSLRDEIRIPAGVPIDFHLTSEDVIHSFWVPRLGGKLDMIPGRTNVLRLQADAPGEYRGLCAEFCGLRHAHMQFVVHAMEEEAFQVWLKEEAEDD